LSFNPEPTATVPLAVAVGSGFNDTPFAQDVFYRAFLTSFPPLARPPAIAQITARAAPYSISSPACLQPRSPSDIGATKKPEVF
jgi:hypothetical protein